jgi:hypothetical protein
MSIGDSKIVLARISWYEKMVQTYKTLSNAEREELHRWEALNKDKLPLHDWPGWQRYIGKIPQTVD